MSPLQLCERLAKSDDPTATAFAVAMLAKDLSTASPADPYRLPWPVDAALTGACRYLHLDPAPGLIERARGLLDDITPAILNRQES